MNELLRKAFYLGVGVYSLTREKVEQVVDELVKRGEMSRDEAKGLVDELVGKGEEERVRLFGTIRKEVERVRSEMGWATKSDLARIEERLSELEKLIRERQ